jgi:misacylated tRNA(Ala) deacylase
VVTVTEPLYQSDAYLAAFDAQVTGVEPDGVVLDRSAFFPGGGGQPPDTGVLEVRGGRAGRHRGPAPRGPGRAAGRRRAAAAGAKVRGRLDWERRHTLMRTHTALHMLSGVIGRDYGALVTGGNFEEQKARMDFELSSMSAEFAEAVERALRVEVDADRPVHVSFLSPEEFAVRPELIRTKANLVPQGLARIRVIDIEGLDRQADGGTHVASTGEVGTIYVVGHQSKGKGNKRLRIALDPVPPPRPTPSEPAGLARLGRAPPGHRPGRAGAERRAVRPGALPGPCAPWPPRSPPPTWSWRLRPSGGGWTSCWPGRRLPDAQGGRARPGPAGPGGAAGARAGRRPLGPARRLGRRRLVPAAMVEREVAEESGFQVRARRLLALWDRSRHNPGPFPHSVYKVAVACDLLGGSARPSIETLDAGWFRPTPCPSCPPAAAPPPRSSGLVELDDHPELPPDLD